MHPMKIELSSRKGGDMKTPWTALALVIALLQLACGSREAEFTAQDEAAVRALADSAVAYLRAGNPDAWAGLYAEDGVLHPPNQPEVRGRSALQEYARGIPVENIEFTEVEVQGHGPLAYGTSGVVFKVKGQAADTGKQLWVARRNADGRWEVSVVSFNSDRAATGGK
jgi:uncharacterized protein (TIGR02246 family)